MHPVHQAGQRPYPEPTATVVGVIMAATSRCVTLLVRSFPHLGLLLSG